MVFLRLSAQSCQNSTIGLATKTEEYVPIDDFHLGAVADVEPARGLVHRQVVPSAFAADGYFFQQLVQICRAVGWSCQDAQDAKRGCAENA